MAVKSSTGWRAHLPQDGFARFRGVPFRWKESTLEGGKRAVVYEFPLRDQPYTQDLGRMAHRFPIAGYVIQDQGGDYFSQRDNLILALERQDPGTLNHPFYGEVTVQVLNFSVKESQQDGGIAYFDITFVEAGDNASPTASADTSGYAISAANDVAGKAFAAFTGLGGVQTAVYQPLGLPVASTNPLTPPSQSIFRPDGDAVVSNAAVDYVFTLQSNFAELAGTPGGFDLTSFGTSLAALYASAGSIIDTVGVGLAIYSLVTDYSTAITAPVLATGTPITAASGAVAVPSGVNALENTTRLPPSGNILTADPTYGMGRFATWGNDIVPIAGGSASAQQAAANLTALRLYVQSLCVSSIGRIFAATTFASSTSAEDALALLEEWLDALIELAADSGLTDLYFALLQLLAAVSRDINERAALLPAVKPYTIPASLPAETLSNLLYQDASHNQLLVAINDAPHPLFLPITGVALTAA